MGKLKGLFSSCFLKWFLSIIFKNIKNIISMFFRNYHFILIYYSLCFLCFQKKILEKKTCFLVFFFFFLFLKIEKSFQKL